MNGWTIETSVGDAESFHHRDLASVTEPMVWIHRVARTVVVLGSSQRVDILDTAAAARLDIEVCSRRSGGGLVVVEPAHSCWIDVLIPPTHERWSDDVNRAFHWVGDVWKQALGDLGVPDLAVHTGGVEQAEAGRFLCFAGLGPGEVVQRQVDRRSKVVGLSQRRQRNIARFQGLVVDTVGVDVLQQVVLPDAWPPGLSPTTPLVGLDTPLDLDLIPDAFVAALQESTA